MLAEEKEVLGFKERASSVLYWAALPAAHGELAEIFTALVLKCPCPSATT